MSGRRSVVDDLDLAGTEDVGVSEGIYVRPMYLLGDADCVRYCQ